MSSASLIRFALLGGAALIVEGGCGTRVSAPRLLDVPANIRPIGAAPESNFPRALLLSAAAQYEQHQASGGASRITEVSMAPAAPKGWAIQEPTAPDSIAQPAAPPRRSEFVPIAMPAQSIAPIAEAPPNFPVSGEFSKPAYRPAQSPELQLTRPDGSGWAGPSVPSPENAGRDWISLPQPIAPAVPVSPALEVAAPQNVPQFVPPMTQQASSPAMQVISQRAMQIADQATAMANRGMLYSAHSELLQALALMAQGLDVQTGTDQHSMALHSGITALDEARDFATTNFRPGETVSISSIAAGHRSPVLNSKSAAGLAAVVAQQQYFAYAQNQLTLAAGNLPAGSHILYRLGRLQTAMSAHDADPMALHGPAAIVYHQAALATDRGNWLAANELGVLYTRYGQLAEARNLLVHSVATHPNLEGWHNLSIVHRRLGEADLAQKASAEWQLLAKQTGKTRSDGGEMVRWVDTQTFAAGSAADARWPATTAAKPVTAQNSTRR